MPPGTDRKARPNVVLIVADDMGWGDVKRLNPASRIPTPHIDRLAADGRTFTDAHSPSAVCTPSRYGILTGRYCWRTDLKRGVFAGYEPPLIESSRPTIASVFKHAGYRTAIMGKWHVGLGFTDKSGQPISSERPFPWGVPTEEFESTIDFGAGVSGGPVDLGFDEFFGTANCPTCNTPYGWIEARDFVEPPSIFEIDHPFTGRPGMRSASWNHVETDPTILERSIEFIERHASDPFFLYVALSAPHEPCIDELVPPVARGKSAAGPRGDLVWYVDHVVGQIVSALDGQGLSDDTLVVFTSDNGALPGDRVLDDAGEEVYHTYGHESSGPWRGYKAHIWEGGHREPFFAKWPGVIPHGSDTDATICLTDLMATMAGILGVDIPEDAAEDSFDIGGALLGTEPDSPRDTVIHHSQYGVFAVRHGPWKAIFGSTGSGGWPPPRGGPPEPDSPGQLYNLERDPSESENLWESEPAVVARLTAVLNDATSSDRTAPRGA